MSYAPYPAYKDSGVPWLGQVPEGWEVKRLSYATRFKGGSTPSKNEDQFWIDGTIPWVSPKDMKRKEIHDTEDHLTELGALQSASGLIDPGHVMMVVRSGILRHSIPAAINRVPVTVNQDMRVFLPFRELKSEFIYWVIEGLQKTLVDLWSKPGTTVESLETEYVNSSPFPVPSIEEQTAIAGFLDEKTAEIDDLIAKKEELLRLLAEQRTALITHVVTKGLNTNAPMKPSGIDWLGDVPEGWEVDKLSRRTTRIVTGTTPPSVGVDYFESGDINWFSPSDFSDTQLELMDAKKKVRAEVFHETGQRLFPAGSVLLVGIGATLGKVGWSSTPCTSNQQINAICPDRSLEGQFLAYFLLAIREFVRLSSNASTLAILNQEKTGRLDVLVPSVEEQGAILSEIAAQEKQYQEASKRVLSAIKYLKEYRTALITNAVTGKIKVA